ncbi:MAG: TlpA family protein disulfide reductase [Gracilimonas sp.]|uniref:TlpA family protein disulfide reductase n=1 Tax=Gracilimonas TaxID=649462 RepID=UPI001AFEF140|nr:TlpA disulfide reductase family protein [Gracilimonas sp.]MBO6584838.1 TlpA family protein disulfide reductase [Gracilimonas sp.]MBO6615891.1 TlpA family protein disulfide reductase [Gracilimonas sp.]
MNEKEHKAKKTSSFKKELLQWGAIFLIGAVLYGTGYHTEVIGKLQSVILYTGLFQPDVEESVVHGNNADYNMHLLTLDGTPVSFSDFKGKTIFLNFWATWCPPCIAEMPNIQRLHDDIQSEDIVFVMASLDRDPQKARDFIERKEFSFPVYSVRSKPRVYDASIVPTTYVISPTGEIVLKHQGMANYNTDRFKDFLSAVSSLQPAEWNAADTDSSDSR